MAAQTGPTLTDITYAGRRALIIGSIMLVLMIVGRTMLGAFTAYWRATHRPPPPPPTVGFGLLPKLRFPEVPAIDTPTSYRLETATGTLPSFGDRAKVYFMPERTIGLFTDEEAREIASSYDFIFEPEILNARLYRWNKSTPLDSTLQLDIRTLQFKLTTNYLSRPELIGTGSLPDEYTAVDTVKSFLRTADLLPRDMATASGRVTYLRSSGAELVPALSYSDADFAQVDLNRTPIDGRYQMYTPNGLQGVVSAILAGSTRGSRGIVQLFYNYHPVEYTEMHTYPLRSASEAWQVLQSGSGYIAEKGTEDIAIIRSVNLGYYDDYEKQMYLQPVYIFSGDGGFLGYVSALDQRYVQGGIPGSTSN